MYISPLNHVIVYLMTTLISLVFCLYLFILGRPENLTLNENSLICNCNLFLGWWSYMNKLLSTECIFMHILCWIFTNFFGASTPLNELQNNTSYFVTIRAKADQIKGRTFNTTLMFLNAKHAKTSQRELDLWKCIIWLSIEMFTCR